MRREVRIFRRGKPAAKRFKPLPPPLLMHRGAAPRSADEVVQPLIFAAHAVAQKLRREPRGAAQILLVMDFGVGLESARQAFAKRIEPLARHPEPAVRARP